MSNKLYIGRPASNPGSGNEPSSLGKVYVNFRDKNPDAHSEFQSAYDVTKAPPNPAATNVRFVLR